MSFLGISSAPVYALILMALLVGMLVGVAVAAMMIRRREESGEWADLETAYRRTQTDLQQQSDQLSREREELATLMSAISDGILAVDIVGKPLFFNSHFALLFFDREQRDRQPHLGEIFRTPEVLNAFQSALQDGQSRELSVPLYVKQSEIPRYFSVSVAPLRREVGPVYGAAGIFHDVTELKRAEKIRIEFVANVSHELRTPLTAIKGYTETLREDVAQGRFDTAGKFLEIVSRNVARLQSLIGDLLDLSALESREPNDRFQKTPVSTRELTERVIAQVESRRTEKLQTIESNFEAERVDGEPARIEQVLVNLLENAVKYVPQRGKITVSWVREGGSVLLKVADNGPGIPPEHHSRLFERFYRVDQARSRDLGGTGLGLAIVKHIMQRHGGSVWVKSAIGKGTEFICQFPSNQG